MFSKTHNHNAIIVEDVFKRQYCHLIVVTMFQTKMQIIASAKQKPPLATFLAESIASAISVQGKDDLTLPVKNLTKYSLSAITVSITSLQIHPTSAISAKQPLATIMNYDKATTPLSASYATHLYIVRHLQ